MEKLVSIVIPAYNPPKALFKACIESILSQSYSNYEVIVIDDGSKSEFAEYIDKISVQDSRVHVIHQINAGEGGARNVGMKNASGEYIVFVDADDCMGYEWLSYAMQLANTTGADVVCGKVIMCEKRPVNINDRSHEYVFFEKDELWKIQRDMLVGKTELLDGIEYLDVGSCAKLFKCNVIDSMEFPVGVKLSADQVFNHEVLSRCNSYVISNYDSYYYIMNPDSISHVHHVDAVQIMMHSLELVGSHLIDNDAVKTAYNYHVVEDFQKALQFAYFNGSKKLSFTEVKKGVSKSLENELARVALRNVNKGMYASNTKFFKVWLLKNKMSFLYVLLKTVYLKRKGWK